jgi:excisionase family DNA binding protein
MVDDVSASQHRIPLSAASDAAPGPTVSLSDRLAWTLAELAALTGVSVRHLRRLDADRHIPGRLTCGRKVLFAAETVRAWVLAGMPCRERWEQLQRPGRVGR